MDLREVHDSPLRIRDDATLDQLRSAMEAWHKMINSMMDIATSQITGKDFTKEMGRQVSAAVGLLNDEIDAMERILVEH